MQKLNAKNPSKNGASSRSAGSFPHTKMQKLKRPVKPVKALIQLAFAIKSKIYFANLNAEIQQNFAVSYPLSGRLTLQNPPK